MESPHTTLADRSPTFNEERPRGGSVSPQRIVTNACASVEISLNGPWPQAAHRHSRDRGLDRLIGLFAEPGQRNRRGGGALLACTVGLMFSTPLLPVDAARAIRSYLRAADRLLPGAVIACGVTGSIALGAYRPPRSDVDLVAVIADEWLNRPDLIRRLRLLHLSQVPRLAVRAARGLGVSACCNTVFIAESEVSLPVTEIRPLASHTGEIFEAADAFDVNPVIWKVLTSGGIAVRGRSIAEWDLDPQPDQLDPWIRTNLHEYWVPIAAELHNPPQKTKRALLRRLLTSPGGLTAGTVAWCVLGPARMHHTLLTGQIIGKEAAGVHALEQFPQHAPITEVALAELRGVRISTAPPRPLWRGLTASAMDDIITAALD